ncbi:hypothetical protein F9278_15830 [Streptomyces phaeolivaceus]|uniref:Uncharacterized protein n=1 Tax=Streptomyces phaeolivaceus TaxID=2653200 RepID=A0A5P8K3T0_9ACTN|nr:hypothetical protein [Streptomyces phaeolivaceus]QFQ97438.1 hypothetical protein F9278_15830 [Streptomyces phaeolivaceus]
MTNPPDTIPDQITITRSDLAAILAHHADVIAAQFRAVSPWQRAAAQQLDEHAHALTADKETPAVAELLDSALSCPIDQPPAVWVDGDPLMWAIAQAVHARCETGDGGIVHDDPRTIAAAAVAGARSLVLREGADAVFALDYDAMVGEEGDENLGSMREAWDLGTVHGSELLRRMADEQPTATKPEPTDRGDVLREAEAEAERQLATVQRVRHVLELEPVLNRTALEYRGLIISALMADEAQQPETDPAAGVRQDGAQP